LPARAGDHEPAQGDPVGARDPQREAVGALLYRAVEDHAPDSRGGIRLDS
jgi:hypothetical protein